MIEYIGGWIEGATVASRHCGAISSNLAWFSPETAPAWISLLVACFAAYAAWTSSKSARNSNNISTYQIVSSRRVEIIKVSAANISDLLIMSDEFLYRQKELHEKLIRVDPLKHKALIAEIASSMTTVSDLLKVMIDANETVANAVLTEEARTVQEWDTYIKQVFKKKTEITHIKYRLEKKISALERKAAQ